MARTIKLPPRANALVYDPAEVADVLVTLDTLPAGEGVVVDEAVDTEPKARARCRNMAKALSEGVTVTLADIDDPDIRAALADHAGIADDAATEDEAITLTGVKVRTHVVQDGSDFLPVVSLKPAKD